MSSSRTDKDTPDFKDFFKLKLSNQQRKLGEKGRKFLLQLLLHCLKNNPDYLSILRRLHDGTGELFRSLIIMKDPAWDLFITLDQHTQDLVFKEVLLCHIQKYEMLEIERLWEKHKERFERVQGILDINDQKKLTELLSLTPDEKILISNKLAPFTYFGSIDYKEGKLACAAIRHSKKNKAIDSYDFSPTLLKFSEFNPYLLLLKHRSRPLRERFMISSNHWIAGDIQIDLDGKANILFLDSLGNFEKININTKLCMATFASIFTKHNIYFSSLQRQYAGLGCSVFALDDMQHLFTLERYLKDQDGKSIGLFKFLSNQEKPPTCIDVETHDATLSISIHPSNLPLSLARTMQSRQLYNVIEERSSLEQETAINRKQETAATSTSKYFFSHSNERLSKKLQKIADRIFLYIKETDRNTLKTEIEKFTLHYLLLDEIDQLDHKQTEAAKDSASFIAEMAISINDDKLMRVLLKKQMHAENWINSAYGVFKFTPLTFAIKQKNAALITDLLKQGADPLQADGHGRLPIKLTETDPRLSHALQQKEDTPRPSRLTKT